MLRDLSFWALKQTILRNPIFTLDILLELSKRRKPLVKDKDNISSNKFLQLKYNEASIHQRNHFLMQTVKTIKVNFINQSYKPNCLCRVKWAKAFSPMCSLCVFFRQLQWKFLTPTLSSFRNFFKDKIQFAGVWRMALSEIFFRKKWAYCKWRNDIM